MSALLEDPMFFYAIAFAIFLGFAWWKGRAPFKGWLDGEIAKIRDELENARTLRAEAEAVLADYKTKHASAMLEADVILRHAKEEALLLKTQAEADLRDALDRHEEQAKTRIGVAEAEAITAVRAATVAMAIATARQALAAKIDVTTAERLANAAIAELPKLGDAKAKAA